MNCPECHHPKTRIIRTRNDPDGLALDRDRLCQNPTCETLFATHESFVRIIKTGPVREIYEIIASKYNALGETHKAELSKAVEGLFHQ